MWRGRDHHFLTGPLPLWHLRSSPSTPCTHSWQEDRRRLCCVGGAALRCGQNVPEEAAEEALLLLGMAGGLDGGGLLVPGEVLRHLETEAERLRVLALKVPHAGLDHGEQALHHLVEERRPRVHGDEVCALPGRGAFASDYGMCILMVAA